MSGVPRKRRFRHVGSVRGLPEPAREAEDPRALRTLPLRRRIHAAVQPESAHRPGLRVLDLRARTAAQAVQRPECRDVHRLPPGAPDPPARRSVVDRVPDATSCTRAAGATPIPTGCRSTGSPRIRSPSTARACTASCCWRTATCPRPSATTVTATTAPRRPAWRPSGTSADSVTRSWRVSSTRASHEEIFNDNGLPGCVTCHQHHDIQPVSDATLRVREVDVCQTCHAPPTRSGTSSTEMAVLLDSLQVAKDSSEAVLQEAQNAGMEVSQALFELEDVNNAQTRAHSAIHSFQVELRAPGGAGRPRDHRPGRAEGRGRLGRAPLPTGRLGALVGRHPAVDHRTAA